MEAQVRNSHAQTESEHETTMFPSERFPRNRNSTVTKQILRGNWKSERDDFCSEILYGAQSVHMETVVRGRTLEGRTIECPKNYLLTYGLSPRLAYLSLSLVLSLSFHFTPPPF